jgi:hypothetical protein
MAKPVVIVTGHPRSGTSLVMQMLAAGGMPVGTDGARAADHSNPRGYFECERVKHLAADSHWVRDCGGHALKVVTALVPFLPRDITYHFIKVERAMCEVMASQARMIGPAMANAGDASVLAMAFDRMDAVARAFIAQLPNAKLTAINYSEAIDDPASTAASLVGAFADWNLDADAMIKAVDCKLYRNRS